MTRAPILVHPEQAADLKVEVEIVEGPVVLPPACDAVMKALDEDLRDLPPELEEHLFQAAQAELDVAASPTTPTCCLLHQTNGPHGLSCRPVMYSGWGATYMRTHAEERFRDFGYTESMLKFVLDHPREFLILLPGTNQAARDTILAYLRGLCCPARVQKADYENVTDPLQVTCSACKAPAPTMCRKQGTTTELVRLLDEKWLPLLEPYLNVEQQHELREDILTAAGEKV